MYYKISHLTYNTALKSTDIAGRRFPFTCFTYKNNGAVEEKVRERRQKQTDGERGQKWHPNIAAAGAEMPAGDSVSDATEPKVRCMLVKLSCRQHFPEVIVPLINIHLNLISLHQWHVQALMCRIACLSATFFPMPKYAKKRCHTSLKTALNLLRLSAALCFSSPHFVVWSGSVFHLAGTI